MYYLHRSYTADTTIIRKIKSDNSLSWMAAVSFFPIIKSFSVDSNEKNIYVGSYGTTQLNVCRFLTSTGAIVDAQTFTTLNSVTFSIKITTLTDNSGYYVTGSDSSNVANICKYLFLSPTTANCQQITNFYKFVYGQVKISDSSFFMLGYGVSPFPLHFYRITFGSTSPDWADKMLCSSGSCTLSYSESQLSSDKSKIYTFISYGSPSYLYFITLSTSDGSILSSRYKSSINIPYTWNSAVSGDYIMVVAYGASTLAYLLILNTATNIITTKNIVSGIIVYDCGVETSTGRFVLGGYKGSSAYLTKFMIQSIEVHQDISTGTWTMNALSTGTDDIISESGQTIGTPSSRTVNAASYTNQTVVYVPGTSYISDVYYQTFSQTYTYSININTQITPDLTCSSTGGTSIIFSLAIYNGNSIPSWVSVDSSSGILTISTPNISTITDYSFYISATISGVSNVVNKLITITVQGSCSVSNCQTCSTTDSSVCTTCNSGYTLSSGQCMVESILILF